MLRDNLGVISGAVVLLIHSLSLISPNEFEKFVTISYKHGDRYGKGVDDLYLCVTLVLLLTALRQLLLVGFFKPLGRAMGIKKDDLLHKFGEQGWTALYYSCAWLMGAHLFSSTPYFPFNLRWIWENEYPYINIRLIEKLFYLCQGSYWLHMIFITVIEEHRKDFGMMMAHHVITNTLIFGSYYCHGTSFGTVVLFIQDFADIFLPIAKMFKYAKWQKICDFFFATFAVAWIPSRHMYFFVIPYTMIYDFYPLYYAGKIKYDPSLSTYEGLWWMLTVLFAFLMALQVLLILWCRLLIKAIIKVLQGGGADDERSGSEDDAKDDNKEIKESKKKK